MSWFTTSARRALWLVVLGATGGTIFTWWRQRQTPAGPTDPPEWPPIRVEDAAESPPAQPEAPAIIPSHAPDAKPPSPASPSNAAAFVNALVDTPDARSSVAEGVWAAPNDDGSCPDGFPIKANDNSGIYHLPTGRFYARTKAERCYATAEGAEADGYRAAKS